MDQPALVPASATSPFRKALYGGTPLMLLVVMAGLVQNLSSEKDHLQAALHKLRAQTDLKAASDREREQAQLARTAITLAMVQGWDSMWKLLPEELPRLAKLTGGHHEVREIAVKALETKVSTVLNIFSKVPPVFTYDGRWIIHLTPAGEVKFTEAWFLNAPEYLLPARATGLAVSGNILYYQENDGWIFRKMDFQSVGNLTLGPPLPHSGDVPSPPFPQMPPLLKPLIGANGNLFIEHPPGTRTRILSSDRETGFVLSPDGRQLLTLSDSAYTPRLWWLNRLREELAPLQLDWNLPPFPEAADSMPDWGKVIGPTPSDVRRIEPASLAGSARESLRLRVVLPNPRK